MIFVMSARPYSGVLPRLLSWAAESGRLEELGLLLFFFFLLAQVAPVRLPTGSSAFEGAMCPLNFHALFLGNEQMKKQFFPEIEET